MSPSTKTAKARKDPASPVKKNSGPGSPAVSPGRKKGGVRRAGDMKKKRMPWKSNPSLSTDYPPADIDCLDTSDPSDPRPLDHFLQDRDIVSFIKEHVDESDLNTDFYGKFEDCATNMWTGPNYPVYACSTLGFSDTH